MRHLKRVSHRDEYTDGKKKVRGDDGEGEKDARRGRQGATGERKKMKMSSERGTQETGASPTSVRSRPFPGERQRVRKQEKQEPEIDESAANTADSETEKEGWEG